MLWSCWMIGVIVEGARSSQSQQSAIRPSLAPVKPIVVSPRPRPACNARRMFGEPPEVEIPRTASPGRPSASTWRSKM